MSGTTPCPICGSAEDCRTHSDEAFACCVQRPSDWRLNNGGWLHRVEVSGVKLARSVGGPRLEFGSLEYGGRDFGSLEATPSGVP